MTGTDIPTGTTIGTGAANTTAITSGCATAGIAARIARAHTGGGKSDWSLPSRDELNQLYLQKANVGGFVAADYWSSSQSYPFFAWFQDFGGGSQTHGYKNGTNRVRHVRGFQYGA